MKKITMFVILLVVTSSCLFAQNQATIVNELGINFSNLNSFGLRFKHGNDTTFLRLTLLSINGLNSNASPDTLSENKSSIGFGFNIGFEKRKKITDKSSFYYGLDLLTSYNSSFTNDIQDGIKFENTSASIGFGLVLGWSYKIGNDIFIAAEIVPSINYTYNKLINITTSNTNNTATGIPTNLTRNLTTNLFTYGLSSSGVNLTLSYRFGK